MFLPAQTYFSLVRQAQAPFVFSVVRNASRVAIEPARIDTKLSGHSRVDKAGTSLQARFFRDFTSCRIERPLARLERASDRLPEFKGLTPLQQQCFAVFRIDDDENRLRSAMRGDRTTPFWALAP